MAGGNLPCVSRRAFLAGGASLAAAASLPSFGDDPALFPGRGRWERLSIGYHHIAAGAERPFSILHISDTHLTAAYPHESEWTLKFMDRRSKTFGGRQEEALRDSLAWAKEHVEYVVHTGDLIDAQSEANLDLVRKYYGDAGKSMIGSLGNHEFFHSAKHDYSEKGKDVTRAKLSAAYPFDVSVASSVVHGVNFVTMDDVFGYVTPAQATRVAAEFAKGLPVILCMHCPVVTARIRRAADRFWKRKNMKSVMDVSNFEERYKDDVTKDFVAYLRSQTLLKAILAGHYHIDVQDRFSPTAVEYVVGGNFLFHGEEITIA